MPPERFPPEDPREWLVRARSNLALASASLPGVVLDDLCFEAQQAAEKATKAVLVALGIAFPYVHDLARLLTLLEEHGVEIPRTVRDADELTRFALVTRYPGAVEGVTEEEYRRAVAIAEAVVAWAEGRVAEARGRSAG